MVRYLLGLSTEEERTQVEERYFSDSEYFDQMLAVEDSLIDDYVTGRMPPERQRAFRDSFSLRGEDIRFSQALVRGVTKERLDTQKTVRPKRRLSLRQASLFKLSSRWLVYGFLTASLILLAVCVLWVTETRSLQARLSQAEIELAKLKEEYVATEKQLADERLESNASARELEAERNRRIEAMNALQKLGRTTDSSDPKTITLSAAFIFRGSGGATKEVHISDSVNFLRFRVPVHGYGKYDAYRVSFKVTGGETIFESSPIKAHGPMLEVNVKLGGSKAGDYILTLHGEANGLSAVDLERYAIRLVT